MGIEQAITVAESEPVYGTEEKSLTKYANGDARERIASFESENEMLDFINDIGKQVYADCN